MVNAPSILQGYGPQVTAVVTAAALLSPLEAFIVTLVSSIAALPVLAETHAVFMLVAYLSLTLRSIEAYIAGYARIKSGYICMGLVAGGFDAVIATLVGIIYYGDDGIHTALSVFGLLTGLSVGLVYKAWFENGWIAGAISAFGLIVFLLSTSFYLSPIGVLGLLGVLAPFITDRKWVSAISGVTISVLVLALSFHAIVLNTSIYAYPFKPSSWSSERWSIASSVCGNSSNVFAHTHDPERLRIVEKCVTIEGTVVGTPKLFEDGDYCFDLSGINGTDLLSGGNIILRKGHLHVEIQEYSRNRLLQGVLGGKVCSGDRIIVSGPVVVDTDHGMWAEIHPVINASLIERGTGPCISISGG
jgi:hypothetical protein